MCKTMWKTEEVDPMTKKPTQRERVLRMLEEGPVCSTSMLEAYIPRGAAVIWDLRQEGKTITTQPCSRPHHSHDTPQIEYELLEEDAGLTPGSNKDDVPAVPSSSMGTEPGEDGTLFGLTDWQTSAREHWLDT